MNTHKVYKTVHVLTGKFYIGKTNGNNPSYLGSGVLLQKYLKKYGPQAFIQEILFDNLTKEEAEFIEESLVTQQVVDDPLCLNLTCGGRGGYQSIEHREKISNSNRIKAKDPKFINKLSIAKLGHKNPAKREDVRLKLKEARAKMPKVECPYCHKVVSKNTANQHHFDNCKVRKEVANA
jgi:hypothetical protein